MIRTDGSHCQRKRERAGGEVEMRFYLRLSELTFCTCLCAREITRESLSIKKMVCECVWSEQDAVSD